MPDTPSTNPPTVLRAIDAPPTSVNAELLAACKAAYAMFRGCLESPGLYRLAANQSTIKSIETAIARAESLDGVKYTPPKPSEQGSDKCLSCNGEGSLGSGVDSVTCHDCHGTGKQSDVAWVERVQAPSPTRDHSGDADEKVTVAEERGTEGVEKLWNDLAQWSQRTFGSDERRGPIGPMRHLEKEVKEVLDSAASLFPKVGPAFVDSVEIADCLMLILDAARRNGLSLEKLIEMTSDKLELNKKRTYPMPAHDQPSEHDRILYASPAPSNANAGETTARPAIDVEKLTFSDLRAANVSRAAKWNAAGVSIEFQAIELFGEAGELCNGVKKLARLRMGMKGGADTTANIAEELADVVICCDLLAKRLDIDLGEATAAKFNATSAKHGFPERLAADALAHGTGALAEQAEGKGDAS